VLRALPAHLDRRRLRGVRTISRATSTDFSDWSAPGDELWRYAARASLHEPDASLLRGLLDLHPGGEQFVGAETLGEALTAEQARSLGVDPGYASDTAETVFMTTRGGHRYTRTFMEGFIRPGPDLGNWASRAGLSALGIVPTGPAEMSLYKQAHYAQPSGHRPLHTAHGRLRLGERAVRRWLLRDQAHHVHWP
jgi:hypothetical protein